MRLMFVIIVLLHGWRLQAQDSLPAVTVRSALPVVKSMEVMQTMDSTILKALGVNDAAEALKYFSGVQVQDYGGAGGLKTINIRGLGALQTAVLLDGMAMNTVQNGMADAGKIRSSDVSSISVVKGLTAPSLSTAAAYNYSGIAEVLTGNADTAAMTGTLFAEAGSFGWLNVGGDVHRNFTRHGVKLSAEYFRADNNYRYPNYGGQSGRSKRSNNASEGLQAALKWRYVSGKNEFTTQMLHRRTDLELPGAVVLYNLPEKQFLKSATSYLQGSWLYIFNEQLSLQTRLKLSGEASDYTDNAFANTAGRLDNFFREKTVYGSTALLYYNKNISASWAADYNHAALTRKDSFQFGFTKPIRNHVLQNLSLGYRKNKIDLGTNLIMQSSRDRTVKNTGAKISNLSPGIGLTYRLSDVPAGFFRAYYKQTYRLPTFNELYYVLAGNSALRPERARQVNIGITKQSHAGSELEWYGSLDVYAQQVRDKIITVPRLNLYQWSSQNIGVAEGFGAEMNINALRKFNGWKMPVMLNLSAQRLQDKSSVSSPSYKQLLPYTPVVYGSTTIGLIKNGWTGNVHNRYTSARYLPGDRTASNRLDAYFLTGISLQKEFGRQFKICAFAENIFNVPYEVVKYYPMPGRNFKINFLYNFKKTVHEKNNTGSAGIAEPQPLFL